MLLAPSVAVAEWLRRATVNRSTRVQFSPVTPGAHRPKDRTERYERSDWGSTPHAPTRLIIESVTQLAEYLPLKQEVVGSLPTGLTKLFRDS